MSHEEFNEILTQVFAEYGEAFSLTVDGQEFYFRPLTRSEFKILIDSYGASLDFEEQVCFRCCFGEPFDFENCKAGIPGMLCLEILKVSGFDALGSAERMLSESRAKMLELDYQMDVVIMSAFPQYRHEEMENWTRRKHYDLFAKAEWSLRELRNVPIEIKAPEKEDETKGVRPLPLPNFP